MYTYIGALVRLLARMNAAVLLEGAVARKRTVAEVTAKGSLARMCPE